ncbi:hypothetical protein FRB90_008957, partial [Tulasnella sp. 427]
MVRASTRSKTATSLAATKAQPKKKAVAVKEAATKATVTAKVKTKAVPKPPPRKGTRASTRGKTQPAAEDENKENDTLQEPESSGDVAAEPTEGERQDENQAETSETAEVTLPADHPPAEEEHQSPEPQEQEDLTVAAPDGSEKTYCICNGADDGSPMITCEGFHFHCIDIDEDQADDIGKSDTFTSPVEGRTLMEVMDARSGTYICPKCHEATGKSTTMKWELTSENGKKAQDTELQESPDEDPAQGSPSEAETPRPPPSSSSSSSDEDDDYVDDYKKAKQNQRT